MPPSLVSMPTGVRQQEVIKSLQIRASLPGALPESLPESFKYKYIYYCSKKPLLMVSIHMCNSKSQLMTPHDPHTTLHVKVEAEHLLCISSVTSEEPRSSANVVISLLSRRESHP